MCEKEKIKGRFPSWEIYHIACRFFFSQNDSESISFELVSRECKKKQPPWYCALLGKDFVHDKRLHGPFCEMQILMKYVECVARRHSCWIEKNNDRTKKNVNDMWERIGNRFIIDPFRKTSGRRKETSWKTIYNGLAIFL